MSRLNKPLSVWMLRVAFLAAAATVIPACGRSHPVLFSPPAAPSPVLATSGESEASLVWGSSGAGVTYKVRRATTSGGPYALVASPAGLLLTDTGLTNGTTYFYVVSGVNAIGEGPTSSEVSVVPAQASTLAAVPTGLLSTAGDQQVTVTWTASSGAASYNVYSAAAVGGPYVLVQNVVGTTLTSTGLTNGVTVFHHVTAVNSLGESAASAPVSATPTAPAAAPGASGLSSAPGDTTVTLSWTAASNATTYTLLRGTVSGGPYGTTVASLLTGTTFTDSGLTNGTPYFYVVHAVNSVGPGPNSNQASATPIAPASAPGSPLSLVVAPGNGQATLSWTAIAGATTYTVLRGSVTGGPYGTTVATGLTGTIYTETGLPNGVPAFYVVRALNSTGTSVNSNEATATPTAPPPPPPTPASLTATADTTPQVVLTWPASAGALGYSLLRGPSAGGPFTFLAAMATPGYTDTAVTSNTTYFYVVGALNIGGLSAYTSPASQATTPSLPPTGLTAVSDNTPRIALSWTVSAGALSYNIKRSISGGAFAQYQNVAALTYNDLTVLNNTLYSYQVTAVNIGGVESLVSNTASATTPPAAPTSLAAVTDTTPRVALTWTAAVGATSYNIKRSVSGGAFVQYQTSTITSFTDPVVVNNTAYAYQVTAVGIGGESQVSNTASVTTPSVAPTGLTAGADNTPRVVLAWASSPGALTYNVKRSVGGGAFTQFAVAGTTAYTDTVVLNNTVYAYMVTAVNIGGVESLASNTASATTPPVAAVIAATTQNTPPQVTLTWPAVTGATGYIVRRGASSGTEALPGTSIGAVTSFNDTVVLNNTQYFYYVIAVGVGGNSLNSNEINPIVPPAAPTALNAVSTNTPQVNLTWTAPAGGATSYKVFKNGSGTALVSGVLVTNYTDLVVVPNTTYTYTVVATNAGGDSVPTSVASATTPPAPPVIAVSVLNTPQVTLTWPTVAGATGYIVKRGATSGSEIALGGPLGAGATSFADTGVVNNTAYFYTLVAVGVGGNSQSSNEVNPLLPPAPPTGLGGLSTNTPQVDLTWTAPLSGAVSYKVFRSGQVPPIVTGRIPTTYTDLGVADNTSYTYTVVATNAAGDSVASAGFLVTTPPAPPVIGFTVLNTPQVTLTWPSVPGATGYNVLRGASSGTETFLAGPLAGVAVSYADTAVVNNNQYFYRVVAIGAGGTSRNSNEVNPLLPPAPPTGLGAVATNTPQVNLNWTAPATGAVSYKVFRGGVPVTTGNVPTNYTDSGLADNTTYTYTVVSTNAAGDSVPSAGATVTTPPAPPVISATTQNSPPRVTINWASVPGAAGYILYRGSSPGTETIFAIGIPGGVTSYPDFSAADNTQYFYYLAAAGGAGVSQSRPSNEVSPIVLPAAPVGLVLTSTNSPQVNLSWGAPGGPLPLTYKVYKNGSINPLVAGIPGTTFSDTGLADNTSYTYTVVATNAGGDSVAANAPPIVTPPAPPVIFATTQNTPPRVTINWPIVPGAAGYTLYRGASSGTETILAIGIPGGSTSFQDASAAGNTQYFYYLVAAGGPGVGQSRNSNEVNPITPPAPPSGLLLTSFFTPQVDLTWTPPGGLLSLTYKIFKNGSINPIVSGLAGTTYTDLAVSDNTAYSYTVVATNAAGDSVPASAAPITTPPAPAVVSVTVSSGTPMVQLNWQFDPAVQQYALYRGTSSGGESLFGPFLPGIQTGYQDNPGNNTTYFYLIRALNANGQSRLSNEIQAIVPPGTPVSLTGVTGVVPFPRVDLTWTAPVGGAPSYQVRRSTGAGFTPIGLPTSATSFSDSAVLNATTYIYDVFASNGGGNSALSNTFQITTAPIAPSSLSAIGGNGVVGLNWVGSPGAASYNVYRQIQPTPAPYLVVGVTVGLALNDNTVVAGTLYKYKVSAVAPGAGGGESLDSNEAGPVGSNPGVPGAPLFPPPTSLDTQVSLNWTVPVNSPTSYNVKRSTVTGGPFTTVGTPGTNSFTDTGLTNGTTYYYVVSGVNGVGEGINSFERFATPNPPPGIPGTPSVTFVPNVLRVTWTPGSNAASHEIRRGPPGGPFTALIGTVAMPLATLDDNTVGVNTAYQYVVRAVNNIGSSLDSLPSAIVTTPPGPPLAVSAVVSTVPSLHVDVTWSPPLGGGASSYKVFRSDNGGPFGPITTGYGPTSLPDTIVFPSSTYVYYIVATSVAGDGPNSALSETVTTPGPPPATPVNVTRFVGNGQVNVNWNPVSGAVTYNVKRSLISGSGYVTIGTPTFNPYVDTTVTNGVTYFYVVSAVNPGGESGNSAEVSATPSAQPPTNVVAVAGNGQVNLGWDSMVGAVSYHVKRSTTAGSGYVTVGSPASNGFLNTGLANGTTYFYVITAVNAAAAETLPSSEVSATPNNGPTVVSNNLPLAGVRASPGYNVILNFSEAMDPLTFVSSGATPTVYLTPNPSDPLIPNPILFYWNPGNTQVTIVFDVEMPVGIYGNDVLADDQSYVLTVVGGPSGVMSAGGPPLPLATDYTASFLTSLDTTPPSIVSITPDLTQPFAGALNDQIQVTFSEPMDVATANAQIKQEFKDIKLQPGSGLTLTWSVGNTVLTINLDTPLPPGNLYRFQLDNLTDANGNFFDNNDQIAIAVPAAGDTTGPEVTVIGIPPSTPELRNASLFVAFNEPMWISDLLTQITVTTDTGTLPVIIRTVPSEFAAVLISGNKAWPAGSKITITVPTTVRDAAGNNLLAARTFELDTTTTTADTSTIKLDEPFSSLSGTPANNLDLNSGSLQHVFQFNSTAVPANRAYLNGDTVTLDIIQVVEQGTGIPVKGYDVSLRGTELRVDSRQKFTGLNRGPTGTDYDLTISPSLESSMGTAIAPLTLTFRTPASAGGNERPSFSSGGDNGYTTSSGGVTTELRLYVQDFDGPLALDVKALDTPDGFNPTLAFNGGQYEYKTANNTVEGSLTTPGDHVLTFIAGDGAPGHLVSRATKAYVFDQTLFPTLTTDNSVTPSLPTYSWSPIAPGLGADGVVLVVAQFVGPGPNDFAPVFLSFVDPSLGSFTQPAGQNLPNGTYVFQLMFFHGVDGSFENSTSQAQVDPSGTFVVGP